MEYIIATGVVFGFRREIISASRTVWRKLCVERARSRPRYCEPLFTSVGSICLLLAVPKGITSGCQPAWPFRFACLSWSVYMLYRSWWTTKARAAYEAYRKAVDCIEADDADIADVPTDLIMTVKRTRPLLTERHRELIAMIKLRFPGGTGDGATLEAKAFYANKTLEAWRAGKNCPDGTDQATWMSIRLTDMPSFIDKCVLATTAPTRDEELNRLHARLNPASVLRGLRMAALEFK